MPSSTKRPRPPEEVAFPVTPFLDMAFQLLAFFILTFSPPSRESRLDLYLPTTPAALPESRRGGVKAASDEDLDLETDLVVRATADPNGRLATLSLGESPIAGAPELEARLRTYAGLLNGKAIRVRFVAPDNLLYGEAARVVGACIAGGVSAVRLAEPGGASR